MQIFTPIIQIFGRFLLWLYNFTGSYVLALVLFTLITKIVLFPFSYKGKESMMRTTALQSQMTRLQKQYKNNPQKYNEEIQKLYAREGVNPMSGCLWTLVPMIILMALYVVIRRPLMYMMCLTPDQVNAAIQAVTDMGYAFTGNAAYQELQVAGYMSNPDVISAISAAVGEGASKLQVIDFKFLGINLAQIPQLKFWKLEGGLCWANIGLFLVPIFTTVFNAFYSWFSMKTNSFSRNQEMSETMNQTSRTMMITMPLMYLWFGFVMPAGMCVYMIANAVLMAGQEWICAKLLRGKFEQMVAAAEKRAEEAKEEERKRKAEIAAKRAALAEENRKNAAKKKKKAAADPAKKEKAEHDREVRSASRVGMRTYARGRNYDPNRYPVTPYRDPDVVDETAVEAAYSKKHAAEEEVTETPELPAEVMEAAAETAEAVEAAETVETAAEETSAADEAFAAIAEETAAEEPKDAE